MKIVTELKIMFLIMQFNIKKTKLSAWGKSVNIHETIVYLGEI